MDIKFIMRRLEHDANVITGLVNSVPEEQMRWKPSAEAWSLLEVIRHLYDEEREDFRTRLDLILHQPGTEWPPIHPAAWVSERGYNQHVPQESIEAFLQERSRSIHWLESLEKPDWTLIGHNPSGFELSAGDMLAAWLAHDMLHVRQLAELHHQHLVFVTGAQAVSYAGEW